MSDLRLSMGRQDIGAGQQYWPIDFTNASGHSCALRGYPGVSVLDSSGHQIGPAATHEQGQTIQTVRLSPGQTAYAALHTTNGPLGGSCEPTGSSLRVYPPASLASVQVPARYQICSNLFTVTPVAPGAGA